MQGQWGISPLRYETLFFFNTYMSEQFKPYTPEEAWDEAELMKEKMAQNENLSYADAEKKVESSRNSESKLNLTDSKSDAIYDKISKEYEKATKRPLREFAYDYSLKYYIGNLSGKNVLDFACGNGASTRILKELGASKVLGLDVSQKMIDLAREQAAEGLAYKQTDCFSDELALKEKYDVITGIMFIQYANSKKQIRKVLENAYSALKEDGTFYLMTVKPSFLKDGYEKYGIKITPSSGDEGSDSLIELHDFDWNKFCDFSINYWNEETYKALFEQEGFKIEWLPGLISNDGLKEYGEDFWKDFKKKPPYMIIKATKNKSESEKL